MEIPLLDLKRQYDDIRKEIDPAVHKVMESSQYIMGSEVKAFEQEIADYLGCKYAISCANGTDALVLAMDALGIGPGDEVITTPFTFFATAEAISRLGAKPVFVDVHEQTYNIDPNKIEDKINSRTKAILPVHLFGQTADMAPVLEISRKYGIPVIEDACQAMGAGYYAKKAGTLGNAGCFSFFPTKNLSCFGDGGLVVTDDERIMKIVRALRAHGSGKVGEEAYSLLNETDASVENGVENTGYYNYSKYINYLIGYNSRLDEMQAAILRVKLKYLDQWNGHRRRLADNYRQKLKDAALILPHETDDIYNIYHQFVIQSNRRDDLAEHLKKKGVATGVYYPVPLHLQKALAYLGYQEGDMPVAEYLSSRTLALPIYPELTDEEQDYAVACIYEFERRK